MASKGAGLALMKANVARQAREALSSDYGIKEGTTILAIHRGSSASGMTHYYSLAVAGLNNSGTPTLWNITYPVALALNEKLIDRDGHRVIKVTGGGMDMGFHLVYSLSSVLFAGQDRAGYALNYRAF